jgi:hypothetical protein
MDNEILARLAGDLRKQGFDARNLAGAGITVWRKREGHFFPAEEAARLSTAIARREVEALIESVALRQ